MPPTGHHRCMGLGRDLPPASPERPARQRADPAAVAINPGACVDQDGTKAAERADMPGEKGFETRNQRTKTPVT